MVRIFYHRIDFNLPCQNMSKERSLQHTIIYSEIIQIIFTLLERTMQIFRVMLRWRINFINIWCAPCSKVANNVFPPAYPLNAVFQSYAHSPSIAPDDDVFRHLSLIYSNNHAKMSRGVSCKSGSPRFENGITNGAAWYPLTGTFNHNKINIRVRFNAR